MDGKCRIGVDVGGTKIAYCLFDDSGRAIDRFQHPTDAGADGKTLSDTVIASVGTLAGRNGLEAADLQGVGVVMPSFILYDEGYVCMTSAMTGVCDFPMRDYIAGRLRTRVRLDNDSNVAALAEHRFGAGRGSRHMIYVSASTGLGCGIIIDGRLFRGSYGWAGECGHMLITPDEGLPCGCRNQGCFMSYASGRYILEHVSRWLMAGEESVLTPGRLSCETLLEAWRAGDALGKKAVAQIARYWGICLFNIYQLLNINLFVFGGGLTNFGPELFGAVREEFDRFNHLPQAVRFEFAQLGRDAGVVGAAELVRDAD